MQRWALRQGEELIGDEACEGMRTPTRSRLRNHRGNRLRARHKQGEWPRPEGLDEPIASIRKIDRDLPQHFLVRDVYDDRVPCGALLGDEDAGARRRR